jgi:hypothetical protein
LRPKAADVLALADGFCRRAGIDDEAALASWLERNRAGRVDLER